MELSAQYRKPAKAQTSCTDSQQRAPKLGVAVRARENLTASGDGISGMNSVSPPRGTLDASVSKVGRDGKLVAVNVASAASSSWSNALPLCFVLVVLLHRASGQRGAMLVDFSFTFIVSIYRHLGYGGHDRTLRTWAEHWERVVGSETLPI